MKMRKRVLVLVLLMVMALSLMAPATASLGERVTTLPGTLNGTVTLEIRPTQTNVVAVGSNDAWVTFSVYLTPADGAAVPAFSFTLKPDNGMTLSEASPGSSGEHRYSFNDIPRGGTMDYTPATKYYGIGGITTPLTGETWVMDMPVKLPSGTSPRDYFLDVVTDSNVAKDVFTTGEAGGKQYTRMVMAFPLHVEPGVAISGTVRDGSGEVMVNATVLLRQDGTLLETVKSNENGAYKFADISTGSYTVEATSEDTTKQGSAKVTVGVVNVTQNMTVRKGLLGDVFQDGKVNTKDVLKLRRYVANPTANPLTSDERSAANVFEDASINTKDVLKLRRYVANPTANPLA